MHKPLIHDRRFICHNYSPNPLSTACTISFSASSSSSPSQMIVMLSPLLTQAPSTLSTLFAFAVLLLISNVILLSNCIAVLQNNPAGLRCRPVGFLIVTSCETIMSSQNYSFSLSVIFTVGLLSSVTPVGVSIVTGTSYSPASVYSFKSMNAALRMLKFSNKL